MKKYLFSSMMLVALLIVVFLVVMPASLAFTFPWSDKSLTVNDDGKAMYRTIQQAINDAKPGATIRVAAGIYYENVNISKPLKLIGEDKNTTIIDAGEGSAGIYVIADNVTISNFTVRNGEDGIFLNASTNSILMKNNMVNNRALGLCVEQKYDNTIDQSNTINGKPIYYFYDTHGLSDNPKIIENKLLGSLILANSTNFIIRKNSIENGDGIQLINSFNNILRENNMVNNSFYGLWVEGAYNNSIDQSNTINGKPVYYFHDAYGTENNLKVVESKIAGSIILANSSYFMIKNNIT